MDYLPRYLVGVTRFLHQEWQRPNNTHHLHECVKRGMVAVTDESVVNGGPTLLLYSSRWRLLASGGGETN